MRSTNTVSLELYADIVCPWCWIGDRRLFAALNTVRAERPEVQFELSWRPFQLDPTMPAEGRDWEEIIEQKFGGRLRAQPMFDRVDAVGAGDGIPFAFDKITRAPNTVKVHALIVYAQQSGRDPWPLVDACFAAYFSHGEDIGDDEVLVRVAAAHGLSEVAVREQLASGAHHIDVMQSQREASRLGIQGVPFLVLNNQFGVSGAQSRDVFEAALRKAADE